VLEDKNVNLSSNIEQYIQTMGFGGKLNPCKNITATACENWCQKQSCWCLLAAQ